VIALLAYAVFRACGAGSAGEGQVVAGLFGPFLRGFRICRGWLFNQAGR
jgi:hypothetical protein